MSSKVKKTAKKIAKGIESQIPKKSKRKKVAKLIEKYSTKIAEKLFKKKSIEISKDVEVQNQEETVITENPVVWKEDYKPKETE